MQIVGGGLELRSYLQINSGRHFSLLMQIKIAYETTHKDLTDLKRIFGPPLGFYSFHQARSRIDRPLKTEGIH